MIKINMIKKKNQRFMAWLLAFAMLIGMVAGIPLSVAADDAGTGTSDEPLEEETRIINGKCGLNIAFSLDLDTGLLVLNGYGAMTNYQKNGSLSNAPWAEYNSQITTVKIGEGITTIGEFAFFNLICATSYTLPSTLISIGKWAFGANSILPKIAIPNGVISVQNHAFFMCGTLRDKHESSYASTTAIGDGNEDLVAGNPNHTGTSIVDSGKCGNDLIWSLNTSGLLIIKNSTSKIQPMTDYAVGETPWYNYRLFISNVVIGSDISTIGKNALNGLTGAENIIVGTDVSTIKENALSDCNRLTNIDLPLSTKTIEKNAFSGCSGLLSATTENTAGNLLIDSGNEYLVRVLKYAGTSADSGLCGDGVAWTYSALNRTLDIMGNGKMADYESAMMTPWAGYAKDIQTINVYNGVLSLGKNAFAGCENVVQLNIASTVAEIGENAAKGCRSLTAIVLPAACTSIGNGAFKDCTGLLSAVHQGIEKDVTIANDEGSNQDLIDVPLIFMGANPSTEKETFGILSNGLVWSYSVANKSLTISNPTGTKLQMPNYTAGTEMPWAKYAADIEEVYVLDEVLSVGNYAFANMPKLTTIQLGEDVGSIGESAFTGATAVTEISFPAATRLIGKNAFASCNTINAESPNPKQNMAVLSGNDALVWTWGGSSTVMSGWSLDGLFWQFNPATGTLLISGNGAMMDYPMSDMPWSSFLGVIRNLEVAPGVTRIGQNALSGAYLLESVNMGNTVMAVGSNAFEDCVSLVHAYADIKREELLPGIAAGNDQLLSVLTFKNGGTVDSEITEKIPGTDLIWSYNRSTHALNIKGEGAIPDYASAADTPWKDWTEEVQCVSVQTGVTAIGKHAFSDMPEMIDVYLPATVKKIGSEAFRGDIKLHDAELPRNVESVGEYAFADCQTLASIILPTNLLTIGDGVFMNCAALTEVNIPSKVSTIGKKAFLGCSALKTLVLPDGLSQIGNEAFRGCVSLTDLTFPRDLTSIGEDAFREDTALANIVIECQGHLTVDKNAFNDCTGLVKAVYDEADFGEFDIRTGNEPLRNVLISRYGSGQATGADAGRIFWQLDRSTGVLTLFGSGKVTDKQGWGEQLKYANTVVFSSGLTEIGEGLFKDDEYVSTIRMADTVTVIGDNAFAGAKKLESVRMPEALTSLGKGAFASAGALKSVTLPDTLTSIPDEAFLNCGSLHSVTFGKALRTIGKDAFRNCTSLEAADFPASTEKIGSGAFNDCTSLKSIQIFKEKIVKLPNGIFEGCSALETAYFNGTLTQWDAMTSNADEEVKNVNVRCFVESTIYYTFADGTEAAPPVTVSGLIGEVREIISPEIEHYVASHTKLSLNLTENGSVYVTYTPLPYVMTVRYVDSKGNELAEADAYYVLYGESYELTAEDLPQIKGHTARLSATTFPKVSGDCTVDIIFDRNTYVITVTFTGVSLKKTEYKVLFGDDLTIVPQEVDGFDAEKDKYVFEKVDSDHELVINYTQKHASLTIHYVDADGKPVAEDYVCDYLYGAKVSVPSPLVEGMSADLATVTIDKYAGETEKTVTYTPYEYVLTIICVESMTDGYQMLKELPVTVVFGQRYESVVPEIKGYTPDMEKIVIEKVTEDTEVRVTYAPTVYTLTVNYEDEDGNIVKTETVPVAAGRSYTIEPTADDAYILLTEKIQGTMGIGNRVETVKVKMLLKNYTLTINYVDEKGTVIKTETKSVQEGAAYSFDTETIDGYTTLTAKVEGTMPKGDHTETVNLQIILQDYTLTINYVDEKGTVIKTETKSVQEGAAYSFDTATIDGYTTLTAKVEGTMPKGDHTVTVSVKAETSVDPTTDPTVNPTTDPTTEPTTDPTTEPTVDPGDNESNVGKIVLVVALVVLMLAACGVLFFCLYHKKTPASK